MSQSRPTYEELEKRLAAAEPIVEALKHHQVDAVVGEEKIAFLLLREVGEALVHSEAGFDALFNLPGVGMVQADAPALRFTRVNRKFCTLTGYSGAELLTRTYLGLTHPQDRRRDMKALTRVLRAKTDSWSIEKRCLRQDGRVIWVAVHGTVLRDATGRAVRIVAMFTDLTARKQARQTQRQAREELKKRVQERTAELSQTIQTLRRQAAQGKLSGQARRPRPSAKRGQPMGLKKTAFKKAR